tara:strand:- start:95 stop:391 length:297 start_codon:yes stop_codon:yes gene_type:complete
MSRFTHLGTKVEDFVNLKRTGQGFEQNGQHRQNRNGRKSLFGPTIPGYWRTAKVDQKTAKKAKKAKKGEKRRKTAKMSKNEQNWKNRDRNHCFAPKSV